MAAQAERLAVVMRAVVDLHRVETRVEGRPPSGPSIVVANHVSWLDPVVLLALLPAIPIAKVEVAGWPLVGPIGRALGVVFVERGDVHSGLRTVFTAASILAHGASVLSFPEGTTSDGTRVLPFRPALFTVARRDAVPVVPVAIGYENPGMAWTGDATFLPHYLRFATERRCRVTVRIGAVVRPDGFGNATTMADVARDRVADLLRRSHVPAAPARVRPPRPDPLLPPPPGRVVRGA